MRGGSVVFWIRLCPICGPILNTRRSLPPARLDGQVELINAHVNLGTIVFEKGEFGDALLTFDNSLAEMDKQLSLWPDEELLAGVHLSGLAWRAGTLLELGRVREAAKGFSVLEAKAKVTSERYPGSFRYRDDHTRALQRPGPTLTFLGDLEAGQKKLRESVRQAAVLLERESDNFVLQFLYARGAWYLGRTLAGEEALAQYVISHRGFAAIDFSGKRGVWLIDYVALLNDLVLLLAECGEAERVIEYVRLAE
jgi:hypothetical protein